MSRQTYPPCKQTHLSWSRSGNWRTRNEERRKLVSDAAISLYVSSRIETARFLPCRDVLRESDRIWLIRRHCPPSINDSTFRWSPIWHIKIFVGATCTGWEEENDWKTLCDAVDNFSNRQRKTSFSLQKLFVSCWVCNSQKSKLSILFWIRDGKFVFWLVPLRNFV